MILKHKICFLPTKKCFHRVFVYIYFCISKFLTALKIGFNEVTFFQILNKNSSLSCDEGLPAPKSLFLNCKSFIKNLKKR